MPSNSWIELSMEASNKSEIDTSAPFRSVKEAVVLFGESEVKPKQCDKSSESELEMTKQNLEKAHEERQQLARCLSSVQEELHRTKRELHRLKSQRFDRRTLNPEDVEMIKETSDEDRKKKCPSFVAQEAVLLRHPSLRKEKKKPLFSFIGGIFHKKPSKNVVFA